MFKQLTRNPVGRDVDGMAQSGLTMHQLRGIRFFNGEGGAGGTPPADPNPPADPPADPKPTPPAPTPPAPTPQPPAQPTPPVDYKGNPDDYVRELRAEAKSHRIAADEARTAAEKAQEDAKAVQAERDALAAEKDALAREKALILAAPTHGANANLLLDSSSFMKTFADVDLSNEEEVTKAITDAVEKNSAYRASTLPATSGGGHQGGGASKTPVTLDGAVKAALGG